ncbi:uncharacterized protein C11orf16 homolog isoform X1 [Empidonax traillii]|uniref:uncharacterized protein C11orf16 homolog isoform X1 n=2 Tax=Empidonax traillii TaxID=164674 RepID=UPI000FFD4993|nr:uncharacterized protein C11orf16 homolog isoform X1 [Empidonax traillii]
MAHLEGFLPMGHRYCSVRPAVDKFSCSSIVPNINPTCRSSFVVYPAWITEPLTPQRCQWISHCLHSSSLAWERLGRSMCIDSNVPVLVRREQDGFYYRGTVKEEIESERGMFLVEFAKPLASRGKHPVCVQKTAKDDILEYVNGMKHSLLPGDKVLAPWEPDMARYGPGTVLTGIETRDPLRASEDEEIIVQFWNDKKVKLPRNVALWIPPGLWERTVEMIHMPFTSRVKPRESPDANSCVFPCSPKPALIPVCAGHSLAKLCLLCSSHWPRFHCHCGGGMCCLSVCVRCTCCCHPRAGAWWPLPSRSLVFQNKSEEAESSSEPSPCLLELEGRNQEAAAAVATSSSSSDSGWDLKPFPTRSTVVDSAVNTGCSCLEKPKLKDSARPQWKYWKRSHHKSQSSNPGLGSCSSTCTKGKLESKAISTGDTSRVAPANRSAKFETIELSPRGQLTVKEILRDQDFKPSLGEEGFAASEKRRNKRASDNKCKATCVGDDKLDVTDHVRARLQQSRDKHDQPEFSTCTTDGVQGRKFQTASSLLRYTSSRGAQPCELCWSSQRLQCSSWAAGLCSQG